jgi:hypothetical protein
MYCTNCGSQNADTNKFCHKCGYQLAAQNDSGHAQIPIPGLGILNPPDPISQATTIGTITSVVGGGFVILGWFIPWFSLGGLVRWLMSLLGLGSVFGGLGVGTGIGNGLQISLLSLTAGLAAMNSEEGGLILVGLLCWVFAGIMLSLPIIAAAIIRLGFRTYEPSQLQSGNDPRIKAMKLRDNMQSVKDKSVYLFAVLGAIFVLSAAIPFGTAVLGSGYYLTIFGAIVSFIGAFYSKSQAS